MKKYYNITYALLLLLLTPTMLRGKLITALLTSLSSVLDLIHGDFKAYSQSLDTNLYGQTCYMQAMLNDNFDYYQRRIIVRTAPIDFDSFLLWKEDQNKPTMISLENADGFTPVLLNRDGQLGSNNIDFEVVFPEFYVLSLPELKRLRILLNRNKIAPKKYNIVYE